MATRPTFAIDSRFKDIPYPVDKTAESQNYGFRSLKGKPEKINGIKEAQDCPGLQALLKTINQSDSPFFSVGCEKICEWREDGFYSRGYTEFCFNERRMTINVANYADLFHKFHHYLEECGNEDDAHFTWEIQGAVFTMKSFSGFTCAIWTGVFNKLSEIAAKDAYSRSMKKLSGFFENFSISSEMSEPIV